MIFVLPGLVLLLAGLVLALCPAGVWSGVVTRGSRWENQASTTALFLFGGLGWLGAALMILYTGVCWDGWRSERWPEVPATVAESRLAETRQIRSTNPAYRPKVFYEYEVGGRKHRGTRVDLANSASGDRAWVEQELATRFAPGAALRVRVNPRDESYAVIEPGVPAKAGILALLGVAFVAIAGWQLCALLKDWDFETGNRRRKKRRGRRARRGG